MSIHISMDMLNLLISMALTGAHSDIELVFRALADRTRLRLLHLMGDDELCVCFFVAVLGTNQPKVSRHLAYLRRAGLVAARREGKWTHYRIVEPTEPNMARIIQAVRRGLAEDPEMQRDRTRLVKLCCSPASLVHLGGAPLPEKLVADFC